MAIPTWFSNDVADVGGICYIAVTILTSSLLQHLGRLQDFGTGISGLQYFGTAGVLKSDRVAEGGHQQEPEGQYEKSVVHVRVPPVQVP